MTILRGGRGWGPRTEGEALVSAEPLHFSFDVDRETGTVIRQGHPLAGRSIAGKILVFSAAKGGICNHPAIPALVAKGNGPKALVFHRTKPDYVQAAIGSGIAIVDGFDDDPSSLVRSGDRLVVVPDAGALGVNEAPPSTAPAKVELRLRPDEESMLAGEHGAAARWAMEKLVSEAAYWGATEMVDLYSVHVSPPLIYGGDWILSFLEGLARDGARFRCLTTNTPTGVDHRMWRTLGIEEEAIERQTRVNDLLNAMGATPTDTVAPFFLGNTPRRGDHVCWAEGAAVVMANSYYAARANLVACLGVIANAVAGKAPRYGFALEAYRRGNVLVEVAAPLRRETDWDALGYVVNRRVRRYDRIPIFVDLPRERATVYNLKRLASTLPSGGPGAIAMFHAVGITPEARTLDEACGGRVPDERIVVDADDIETPYREFPYEGPVDFVWIGESLTPAEVREVAALLAGRRVKKGVRAWIFTDAAWLPVLDQMGLMTTLHDAGCDLIAGAYAGAFPGDRIRRTLNGARIACDGARACYWMGGGATQMGKVDITPAFRSVAECVEAAVTGRV
ncbi:MAG: DUF521 domain-containing protein [Chloroflexota bacterium]|nr:DUF521 domain-containing protein [Chloroflexota bacterium]